MSQQHHNICREKITSKDTDSANPTTRIHNSSSPSENPNQKPLVFLFIIQPRVFAARAWIRLTCLMSLWCVRMVKQCAVAYRQGPLNLPFRCLDSWIFFTNLPLQPSSSSAQTKSTERMVKKCYLQTGSPFRCLDWHCHSWTFISIAILLIITSDKEDGEEIQTNCDHGILRADQPANQCLH